MAQHPRSPQALAAWCEQERQRVELLPWLQRPEALLRIVTVLVGQLAAEHRDDELGAATERLLAEFSQRLGTDTMVAAFNSWARAPEPRPGEPLRPPPDAPEPRPGEPLRPPPDAGESEDEQQRTERWYADFEDHLNELDEDDEDEDLDEDSDEDGDAGQRA